MGNCCYHPKEKEPAPPQPHHVVGLDDSGCTEFTYADLRNATKNFIAEQIISDESSRNVVYKGHLSHNLGYVAVKMFRYEHLDVHYFSQDAEAVGKLKHRRLVKLIGYSSYKNSVFLVAEFMPNNNLSQRLFTQKYQTMDWPMRLRVAYHIAETLDYCATAGFKKYSCLTADTVLFDENDEACLSSFGLLREIISCYPRGGSVDPTNVAYGFGVILVNLLTGKEVNLRNAPDMINVKDVTELMDPNLKGNFSTEEATAVLKLASKCLHTTDNMSLVTKNLVGILEALHLKREIPCIQILEKIKPEEVGESSSQPQQVPPRKLSFLEEACMIRNLDAIHNYLARPEFDDANNNTRLSFTKWIVKREGENADRKADKADNAFKQKEYAKAIKRYSEVIKTRGGTVSLGIYTRRSFCHMNSHKPGAAIADLQRAHELFPEEAISYYIHSVLQEQLGNNSRAAELLQQAIAIEKQCHSKVQS